MIDRLVLATRNRDKVEEIRKLLADLNIEVLSLEQFPQAPEMVEDGTTLEENAIKKARTIADFTGLPAVADDTGLEVDYLNGQPGVFSSRFAGENASYAQNVAKLLEELAGVPWEKRRARFRCVVAVCGRNAVQTMAGVCDGVIAEQPKGSGGFGYDPVFYVPEYDRTFAEMDLALKNQISHRAQAFLALKRRIQRGEFNIDFRVNPLTR